MFLPPNCTSLIQPLNKGIINTIKCAYHRLVINKLLLDFPFQTLYETEHLSGGGRNVHCQLDHKREREREQVRTASAKLDYETWKMQLGLEQPGVVPTKKWAMISLPTTHGKTCKAMGPPLTIVHLTTSCTPTLLSLQWRN